MLCLAFFWGVASADEDGEFGITKFKKNFPLRILCNYNFLSIWSSELDGTALVSNRPVDVGLGFGYKDFYWDFLYSLPFTASNGKSKSAALETSFDFFPGDWWIKANYRRYSGFNATVDGEDVFIDFWERDEYISALWMATANDEFSPRAAFFLDRKQRQSSGSVIVGARLQDTKVRDYDNTVEFYAVERDLSSVWWNVGYTYTWIYENSMFFNVWGIAGIAAAGDAEKDYFSIMPEVVAKMAYGHFGETWSWNINMNVEYTPIFFMDHWEQRLASSFKILVVRRF